MSLVVELEGNGAELGGVLRGTAVVGELKKPPLALDVRLKCVAKSSIYTEVVHDQTVSVRLADVRPFDRVRFEVPVPARAPVTFTGQVFSVTWVLTASLDLPFARDPSAEVVVQVGPRVLRTASA